MIQCQHCGQGNADQTQFCRFCGHRLGSRPDPNSGRQDAENYTYAPPRPYSWKTDEYQTQSERRLKTRPATQPLEQRNFDQPGIYPLAYRGPQYLSANYRCPNCGTTVPPIIERRISTAGWITFALLLVFTFIFFWVGLLMKQDYSVCPVCRATLN
ncbi:MAG: LITAF-like zinc ribbon domain-containing protein [Pyrinomonadaceae bacterium]